MRKILLMLFALAIAMPVAFSQTVVFSEDFESPGPDSLTSSGSSTWAHSTSLFAQGLQSDSAAIVNTGDSAVLTSQTFSTTGNQNVLLKFSHICKIEFFDEGIVEVSTDNGVTWTQLTGSHYLGTSNFAVQGNKFCAASYNDWLPNTVITPTNSWWKVELFDISALAANAATVQVRFMLRDANNGQVLPDNYAWFIDDITVTASIDELIPPDITLLPQSPIDSVFNLGPFDVYADIIDSSGIDTAYISYTVNGGAPVTVGMVNVGGNTYKATIDTVPAFTLGDTVCYTIYAIDGSLVSNMATYPSIGCQQFVLYSSPPPPGCGTPVTTFPLLETFDSWTQGGTSCTSVCTASNGWTNVTVDDKDWCPDAGGTGSGGTGPLSDHTTGTSSGKYLYTEASGCYNKVAIITSPCLDLTQMSGPKMEFWYHMHGQAMGELHVDIYYGGQWVLDIMPPLIGEQQPNQSDPWLKAEVNLGQYKSITKIRFRGITGTQFYSDMAIDDVKIFEAPDLDAGIVSIDRPLNPVLTGVQDVKATLQNFGALNLTSCTINWSVDGVLQTPYAWTGNLGSGFKADSVLIGSYTFVAGPVEIKAWTSAPNAGVDTIPQNDTTVANLMACDGYLSGNYTVGGATADYANMNEVMSALMNCGIDSTTVFLINSGTYTDQFELGIIPGADAQNTVTFQSATGNPDDVIFQFTATGPTDNYIFYMNDAKHIRIKNLTLKALGATYATCVKHEADVQDVIYEGNKFIGIPAGTNSSSNLALVYSYTNSRDSAVAFISNHFKDGAYGAYMYGNSSNRKDTISFVDNIFEDHSYSGMYGYYINHMTFTGNVIEMENSDYLYTMYGMRDYYGTSGHVIMNNRINIKQGYGMYLGQMNTLGGPNNVVANNFITVGKTTTPVNYTAYGMYLYYVTGTDILHNSIMITSLSTSGRAIYMSSGVNTIVKNNSMYNQGPGQALYISSSTSNPTMDHNNLYSEGTNLAYKSGPGYAADLAAWIANTGQDSNSVSVNPDYFTAKDLHTLNIDMNAAAEYFPSVMYDIDGQMRDTITPDIGADEYTPPANDAGVIEIVSPDLLEGENQSVPVDVIVKNFGTDTITSMSVEYSLNGNTPVTFAYTGNLASTETDTVHLPAFICPPGNNHILATTDLVGDTIPINDTVSKSFYGDPQIDAGVTLIVRPTLIDSAGLSRPVTAVVKNFGTDSIKSGLSIKYSVNGGTAVSYAFTDTLAPNGSAVVDLPNLVIPVDYNTIKVYTEIVADGDATNDTTTLDFYGQAANDIAVTEIWTLGKLPIDGGLPHVAEAIIENTGYMTQSNIAVTLAVSGANTATSSVTVPTLLPGQIDTVTFSGYNVASSGVNNVNVSVPTDDNAFNNSVDKYQLVTTETMSYSDTTEVINNLGFGGTTDGMFFTKYKVQAAKVVSEVKAYITGSSTVGLSVYGVLMDSTGTIVDQSVSHTITASDTGQWVSFLMTDSSVSFVNEEFYAGFACLGGGHPVGLQAENPVRPNAYFYIANLTGGTPTDAASQNFGRHMIEVTWTDPVANDAAAVTFVDPAGGCGLGLEDVTLQIQNAGSDTITSLTASYCVLDSAGNYTGIVTETVSASIAPAATYDYTFSTQVDLSTVIDSIFQLKGWVVLTGDPFQNNDTTMAFDVTSKVVPPAPVTTDDTVSYGNSAMLTATSAYPLTWYTVPTGGTEVDTGAIFNTPPLYDTTTYYVEATSAGSASLIITELDLGGPDYIEIHNPSSQPIDATGWFVVTSDDYSNINDANSLTWSLGVIPAMGVDYREDVSGSHYWGNNLFYNPGSPAWVMIIDANGNVVDALFTGWTASDIAAMSITVNGFTITPGTEWIGDGLTGSHTVCYRNTFDGDDVTDWTGISVGDKGLLNPGLTMTNASGTDGCPSVRVPATAFVTGIPANDLAIDSFSNPADQITALVPEAVDVWVKNYGTAPITSFNIDWTLNGVAQQSYTASAVNIPSGGSMMVTLGNVPFNAGQSHWIAWIDSVNGGLSAYTPNDTLNDSTFACISTGTYTIGSGATDNFSTFAEAIDALVNCGITGPVIFDVQAGTYTEQVTIPAIPGASATNTVTFRSITGDSTDVTVQYQASSSANSYTWKFNSCSHVIVESMTIKCAGTSYGYGVEFGGGASNNTLQNCEVQTLASTSSYARGIVSNSGNDNNNLIKNNHVLNGYYGIYMYGTGSTNKEVGNVLEGNVIENFSRYGIYLYYQDGITVTQNTIMNDPSQTYSYGFYTYYSDNSVYTRNELKMNNSSYSYPMYLRYSTGTTTDPNIVANNMISVSGGTGTNYGLYSYYCQNTDYVYNSVSITSGNTSSRAFYHYNNTSYTGVNVINNIFANFVDGYAYYNNTIGPIGTSNYNDLYTTGTYIGYWGANITDLATWKTTSSKDANSISADPVFISSNNLHASATAINDVGNYYADVLNDFDGEVRSLGSPDMGADEFTPALIDAGAELLVTPIDGTCYGANEVISVRIKNYGIGNINCAVDTIYLNVSVSGINPITYPVVVIDTGVLAVGQSWDIVVDGNYDMSQTGQYVFTAYTSVTADGGPFNDQMQAVNMSVQATISSFPYSEDIETWTQGSPGSVGPGWVREGNNYQWHVRSGSTSSSSTGPNGDHTTGTGLYIYTEASSGTSGDVANLISPCMDLSVYTNPVLSFWYHMYGSDINGLWIDALDANGSWVTLDSIMGQQHTASTDSFWKKTVPMPGFTSHITRVRFRAIRGASFAGDIAIDDIFIIEPKQIDPGMKAVLEPAVSYSAVGQQLDVKVQVQNYGWDSLTYVPVAYRYDMGTIHRDTIFSTMFTDDVRDLQFIMPFTVAAGTKMLECWTEYPGDMALNNDTIVVNFVGIPVMQITYFDDFEGTNYFAVDGGNFSWQHGAPAGTVINTAHSPTNVWATNLTGNYYDDSNDDLLTPFFDFSTLGATDTAKIEFWHWYDMEVGYDYGVVQYTVDGGANWVSLGFSGPDPMGSNWYDGIIGGLHAFNATNTGWKYSTYKLDPSVFNQPTPVQFRFRFHSDGAVNSYDGWAIDDFKVSRPMAQTDVGVASIDDPTADNPIGSQVTVKATIENFGILSQTSIPITLTLNGQVIVTDTWTGQLNSIDQAQHTFSVPYTVPNAPYTLCVYTGLANDAIDNNDTVCVGFGVTPGLNDVGVSKIVDPNPATSTDSLMINGPDVFLTVRIKNYGVNTQTSIPVEFEILPSQLEQATWTGSLASGDSVDFTFSTKMTIAFGNFDACARTMLLNDVDPTNDEVCNSYFGYIDVIEGIVDGFLLYQNIPNPTMDATVISYEIPTQATVRFGIVDIFGRSVYNEEMNVTAGKHNVYFNTSDLAAGTYYYFIEYEGMRLTRKMVVTK